MSEDTTELHALENGVGDGEKATVSWQIIQSEMT